MTGAIEQLIAEADQDIVRQLAFGQAKRFQLLPVRISNGAIEVLVSEETDPFALDEYRMRAELPVRPVPVASDQFLHILQQLYEKGESPLEAEQILGEMSFSSLVHEIAERSDLLESEDDAPIIQLVNTLIIEATRDNASDIHVEPFENDIVVRFRVDGILHNMLRPPKPVQAPLMSRIKVMAGLNIAEKRLPQDGGMRVQVGQREVDVRVSVLPTSHGERIVLRLLRKDKKLGDFADLGFTEEQAAWLDKRLARSYGILLVTGPTGSGKSTTLYAALNKINTPEKNIITVEDPIEYSLPGVGQIQVNPKIGLTFASGLRSILRQDPDIIMVGEIRDLETADISIQASLTGHLVLSTLHTNDSIGAITRLIDMGIEPFLVSSSLEGVVAQRLVRLLCDHCKDAYEPSPEVLQQLFADGADGEMAGVEFYRPRGCDHCIGTGYRGRTAIFELLTISDSILERIDRREPEYQLRKQALKEGMVPLRKAGINLARQGKTSIEEVLRVTQDLNEAV